MRVKVNIDTTNIGNKGLTDLNIDVKTITKDRAIKEISDNILEKVDLNNQFCEHKILKKVVKLDIYNSSTIDLVKQKIESLVGLPMITKIELLTLLDDDNMFKQCHFISNELKYIIEKQDESALSYFMRKQFDFRVKVDKITEDDIKILFEDLFDNTFINHEIFYDMFINNYALGFLTNGHNYYYQVDVFRFLTNIKNYERCQTLFHNQTGG